jgi:hypothetical protein
MTYKYSATYEFMEEKPETVTGELNAPSHQSAFRDAMKALRKAHKGRRPSSIVIVLEILKEVNDNG